jgi:hypothetical protein
MVLYDTQGGSLGVWEWLGCIGNDELGCTIELKIWGEIKGLKYNWMLNPSIERK